MLRPTAAMLAKPAMTRYATNTGRPDAGNREVHGTKRQTALVPGIRGGSESSGPEDGVELSPVGCAQQRRRTWTLGFRKGAGEDLDRRMEVGFPGQSACG